MATALFVEHFDMAAITPQKWGEMGWILETNRAMNRGMEAMGGRVVKRYRVYERVLGPATTWAPAGDPRSLVAQRPLHARVRPE